jgi:hypothetical protein
VIRQVLYGELDEFRKGSFHAPQDEPEHDRKGPALYQFFE